MQQLLALGFGKNSVPAVAELRRIPAYFHYNVETAFVVPGLGPYNKSFYKFHFVHLNPAM